MRTRTWPAAIVSPSATRMLSTVPSAGASTGCSIFIDSTMRISWPPRTWSPAATVMRKTVPIRGDFTSSVAMVSVYQSARP